MQDNIKMTDAQAIAISASNIYASMITGLQNEVAQTWSTSDHFYMLYNSGKYDDKIKSVKQMAFYDAVEFFNEAKKINS